MNVSQASKIWLDFHRAHSKENTIRAYDFTISKFNQNFATLNLNEVSTDDILDLMTQIDGWDGWGNGWGRTTLSN